MIVDVVDISPDGVDRITSTPVLTGGICHHWSPFFNRTKRISPLF
jgi:hypothetical protein